MHRKHVPLLTTAFLLCLIEYLQVGMVAFGSVPIMGEIGAGPEEYSLVAALYACMAVLSISKQSWLSERMGWRGYILASGAVFMAGGLACATSERLLPFTIGRALMGLGGGAFFTSGRVLLNRLAPGPERFHGIKVFATALACGTAASPWLAATAVTNDSWRSIFWITIGVTVLACLAAAWGLPTERHADAHRSRTSLVRVALLAVGAFAVPYVIQRTPYEFYTDTPLWLANIAAGVLVLYLFFHVEHQHARPLLRVKQLLSWRYLLGVALFCFCYIVVGANNYVLPIFLQRGMGYSWQTTGAFLSLGLVAAVLTWLVMTRVLPKSPGPAKYLFVGFLALAAFGLQLSGLNGGADIVTHVLPALALNGIFLMTILPTAALQTFAKLPPDPQLLAHAQQVKSMLGQVATAAGMAFGTVMLQWRSTVHYGALNVHLHTGDPLFQHHLQSAAAALGRATDAAQAARLAMALQGAEIAQRATLLASTEYFRLITIGALLAMAVSMAVSTLPSGGWRSAKAQAKAQAKPVP